MKPIAAFLVLAAAIVTWWLRTAPRRPVVEDVAWDARRPDYDEADYHWPPEYDLAIIPILQAAAASFDHQATMIGLGHDAAVEHEPGRWSVGCRRCDGMADRFLHDILSAE